MFHFHKCIGKYSKIRSLVLNWNGSDSSFCDVTRHKDDFFNKNQIFQIFSVLKTAFCKDRYLFGILSTCENGRENFEEIWPDAWEYNTFGK